jgi:hypothetical protein
MTKPRELLGMVGAGMVGGLLVLVLGGAQAKTKAARPLEVVAAREFRLVAANGRELAALHSEEGDTQFALYGPDGKPGLVLALHSNGTAAVTLGDPGSKEKAMLVKLPSGGVALSLQSKTQGSMIVGAKPDTTPNIEIYDGTGKVLFQAVR